MVLWYGALDNYEVLRTDNFLSERNKEIAIRDGFYKSYNKAGKLKTTIDIAKNNPNLLVADYPKDMLNTRTDEELVASINSKENEKLEYMGAVIYGNTKDVDEITGKFQLWRID